MEFMSEIFQNYASMQIFASIFFLNKGIYNACVFKITCNFRSGHIQYLFSYDKVNILDQTRYVFSYSHKERCWLYYVTKMRIIFKIFYNIKSLIYQKEQHQAIRPTVIWLQFFFRIFVKQMLVWCAIYYVCACVFLCVFVVKNTQLCLYFILSIHSNGINSRTRFCKILIK